MKIRLKEVREMEEHRDTSPEETPQPEATAEQKEQAQEPTGQPGGETRGRMYTEEWTVRVDQLMDTVNKLIHDSTVNRVRIKNREGRVLLDIPVWAAAIGGVAAITLAPLITAVGVVGGLLADFRVEVERFAPPEPPVQPEPPEEKVE